jgi:hypothetical protein
MASLEANSKEGATARTESNRAAQVRNDPDVMASAR